MTLNINKTEKETLITVEGRLDTITAPSLEAAIRDVDGRTALVLDFEKLEYISSAGLRVLLGAQKKMQVSGSLKILNACEEVMEVFEMTGFSDILTIA